jgi:hypothetical protein
VHDLDKVAGIAQRVEGVVEVGEGVVTMPVQDVSLRNTTPIQQLWIVGSQPAAQDNLPLLWLPAQKAPCASEG